MSSELFELIISVWAHGLGIGLFAGIGLAWLLMRNER